MVWDRILDLYKEMKSTGNAEYVGKYRGYSLPFF